MVALRTFFPGKLKWQAFRSMFKQRWLISPHFYTHRVQCLVLKRPLTRVETQRHSNSTNINVKHLLVFKALWTQGMWRELDIAYPALKGVRCFLKRKVNILS